MYSFRNDYSELAAPFVMEKLLNSTKEQNTGYGLDKHSDIAKELIKKELAKELDVEIHFLVGGTSCNKIVISHTLRPYEAVVSVKSGHINVHETGAVEASGHKVLTVDGVNGKITCDEILGVLNHHTDEHMVVPKMVYISNATEIGTIYSKNELTSIYEFCQKHRLILYIDGARLGASLTAEGNDLTLAEISSLCDLFYIGGTKNGAMFGEALVIINDDLKNMFRHSIKLNGGMLAKGYAIGIQFEALFSNNLFFDLARHSNQMAIKFKNGLNQMGLTTTYDSPTNLQFLTLSNEQVNSLLADYDFEIWEDLINKKIIRIVFSWATSIVAVDNLLKSIENII